jgi:CRISPR system Cascade subunit CasB
MANLRCSLVPARRHRAWPLLARVGGIDDSIAETAAGLFAHHPDETTKGNLGDTCRQLAGVNTRFEGRFRRLLACDRNELCQRIRPIVLTAKAKGIPVNYQTLIEDLFWWGDRVRVRWAQAFWGGAAGEIAAPATEGELS